MFDKVQRSALRRAIVEILLEFPSDPRVQSLRAGHYADRILAAIDHHLPTDEMMRKLDEAIKILEATVAIKTVRDETL